MEEKLNGVFDVYINNGKLRVLVCSIEYYEGIPVDFRVNKGLTEDILIYFRKKYIKLESKINKGKFMYGFNKNAYRYNHSIHLKKDDLLAYIIIKFFEDYVSSDDVNFDIMYDIDYEVKKEANIIANNYVKKDDKDYVNNDKEVSYIESELYKILSSLKPVVNSKNRNDYISLLSNSRNIRKELDELINRLKDKGYKRNYELVSKAVNEVFNRNLLKYIDVKSCKISIFELLDSMPPLIITLVANDVTFNINSRILNNLYHVINIICYKEDGSKYSKEEINKYILLRYKECLLEQQELDKNNNKNIKKLTSN